MVNHPIPGALSRQERQVWCLRAANTKRLLDSAVYSEDEPVPFSLTELAAEIPPSARPLVPIWEADIPIPFEVAS